MKCFKKAGIFFEFLVSNLFADQKLAESRLFLARKKVLPIGARTNDLRLC